MHGYSKIPSGFRGLKAGQTRTKRARPALNGSLDIPEKYRIAGNFQSVIFTWISIINHIHGKKCVVSESIIANHTCAPLVRG